MKGPRAWSLRNRLLALAAVTSLLACLAGGLAALFADRYFILVVIAATTVLVLLNWWMFGRTTRAFEAAVRQLQDRTADDARPIAVDDTPLELRPMLAALDALFHRFGRALDSERHFTAAAAHELRTALAAVRVQAQVAERARTPKEVHAAVEQLGVCVDRASRLIDQLLMLAHFDATPVSPATTSVVRLEVLGARVVNDMNALLRERGISLTTALSPVEVSGLEFGLAALVRNLLDNAARYSPQKGSVRLETGAVNGEAFVAVDDSGPGIPAEERERVFERFYRLQSNGSDGSGTDGSGIGLSIVRSVARAHGARVVLSDSELGGLRATVFLSMTLTQQSGPAPAQTTPSSITTGQSPIGTSER